jgi:hypothetical protein
VRWVVDERSVVVVHRGAVLRLPYPHAAIWDLITLGHGEQRLARQLAVIADLTAEQAARAVEQDLDRWSELGLVDRWST